MKNLLCLLACLSALLIVNNAIKCYRCKNCSKYESSHSVVCATESNACVKMDLKSGEVERSCGTLEKCEERKKVNSESNSYYTAIYCCQHNHCNGSPPILGYSKTLNYQLGITIGVVIISRWFLQGLIS